MIIDGNWKQTRFLGEQERSKVRNEWKQYLRKTCLSLRSKHGTLSLGCVDANADAIERAGATSASALIAAGSFGLLATPGDAEEAETLLRGLGRDGSAAGNLGQPFGRSERSHRIGVVGDGISRRRIDARRRIVTWVQRRRRRVGWRRRVRGNGSARDRHRHHRWRWHHDGSRTSWRRRGATGATRWEEPIAQTCLRAGRATRGQRRGQD